MLPLANRGRFSAGLLALGLVVVFSGACASDEVDFGPMAVVDDPDPEGSLQVLGGSGPVDIGERCVMMTRDNGTVALLVWRSGEVNWDDRDRAITFSNVATGDPTPVTMRDGDVITIGGVSFDREGRRDRQDPWLAEPDEGCKADDWFSVHSVSLGPMPTR